jgi:hypothetical protein
MHLSIISSHFSFLFYYDCFLSKKKNYPHVLFFCQYNASAQLLASHSTEASYEFAQDLKFHLGFNSQIYTYLSQELNYVCSQTPPSYYHSISALQDYLEQAQVDVRIILFLLAL